MCIYFKRRGLVEINGKRKHPRKSLSIPITYSVNVLEFLELKKIHKKAMTTDISDKGIGLITDYPLEPGHVLILSNSDRNLSQKIAIVRWAMKSHDSYRVGLELV